MYLLPIETWEEIFKTHLDAREWVSLSITSSFFRPIAQEALFEDVALSRTLGKNDHPPENRILELFARSLKQRPKLATLVRTLHVEYDYGISSDDIPRFDCFSHHPILENLALFTALRRLTVENFIIEPEFCSALRIHSRLTTIEFRFCSVDAALSNNTLQALEGTLVSNIIINAAARPVNIGAWAAVVPVGIRSLTFGRQQDPVFIDAVLSHIRILDGTKALTTLRIGSTTSLPPNLITLLTSTPQIQHLSLGWTDETIDTLHHLQSLPAHAIPLLQDFTGPANFITTFVRGRPVHTVKLLFSQDTPVDVLSALRLSTVSVTTLEVPSHNLGRFFNKHKDYLSYAPSTIICFSWYGFRPERDNAKLYHPSLSNLRNVRVVRCHISQLERKIFVRKYSETCPSIREFDFWQERWVARKDGSWERYLSAGL